MSVTEILHQIELLPANERWQLAEKLLQILQKEIPESLRESMAEVQRGELIDLDVALQELDAP